MSEDGDPGAERGGLGRAWSTLRIPHYTPFFIANFAQFLFSQVSMMAMYWLMTDLTDSRFYITLVSFFQGATIFVLSPWGGVIADRVAKKWLLVGCRIAMVALVFVMGALVAAGVATIDLTFTGEVVAVSGQASVAVAGAVVGTGDFAITMATLDVVTGNAAIPGSGASPGGGSGGSAAATALTFGPLHVATDGGGSTRLPAAHSGVFGFKPTFGRVPVYPPSQNGTLFHVTPMTRRVDDAGELDAFAEAWTAQSFFRRDPRDYDEVWLYELLPR